MNFTLKHEKQIRRFVESKELKVDTLRDDIIDHLCSDVKNRMKDGVFFEKALKDAVIELAPNGLKDVDQQALDLINGKTKTVKKATYSIGFIGSTLFVLGLFFTRYDQQIGEINFGIGIAFLVFFLPLYAIDKYHVGQRSKIEIIKLTLGSLTGVIYGIGVFLKIMGFSSGGLIGLSLIPLLLFIPFLFLSMYKKSISS